MRGRPADPNTDFKIALRVVGKYRYAATQPHVQMPDTGKTVRHFVYWGEVTENLKFIPNDRYLLASEEERGKLIFPDIWDMSELDTAKKLRKRSRSAVIPILKMTVQPFPAR